MSGARIVITMLNGTMVGAFGGLLAASFCDSLNTRRNRRIFWLGTALLLMPQGAMYLFLYADDMLLRQMYPLIFHLPLAILCHMLGGTWLWSVISVLSGYLFCQMRRWPALLVAALLPGLPLAQEMAELIFTVPWLLLFLRFAAPTLRQMMDYPVKDQCQFGLIPALYYAFDYLTRIYTDLLFSGSPVILEFMPTVCCGAYLVFLLYNSAEERKRSLLQQTQNNLKLQVAQAAQEIKALRKSQDQAARHRHDLRHHLQYLLSCIENGQDERAREYISGICAELEAQQVRRYCENEAANLILSAFARRAEKVGIKMAVGGEGPAVISVGDNDLCIILSNALENSLHACLPLAEAGEDCTIRVEFRSHGPQGRLFLQIANPYRGEVRFEKGVPVSGRPGHGIGVQSIRAVVEKYGGGCTFLTEDGQFILRLFL